MNHRMPCASKAVVTASACGTIACLAILVAGCASAHALSPSDAAFFKRFDHKVFAAVGATAANLPPQRRAEIRLIASTLKPQYRTRMTYTYATDGTFIVFLPYGDLRTGETLAVNACYTPPEPTACKHECGLGFQAQFWTAAPLSEDRCADGAPVWLFPNQPLPQFERRPARPGVLPTP